MKTKQFTLYLENRQGVLAMVTKSISDAGVNIEGISISASTDVGLVQLVTSHAKQTEKILKKLKIPFTSQDVSLVALKHRPGELFRIVAKLAKARVNLNYVYATGSDCKSKCSCGCKAYVVISADNLSTVEQACK